MGPSAVSNELALIGQARDVIYSGNSNAYDAAKKEFEKLIKNGLSEEGVSEVIKVATKAITYSPSWSVESSGQMIFNLLLEQDLSDKMVSELLGVKTIFGRLALIDRLVFKGKALPEALVEAKNARDLGLFHLLVDKKVGFSEAAEAAKQTFFDENINLKEIDLALKLFGKLIQQEKGIPEALSAAKHAMDREIVAGVKQRQYFHEEAYDKTVGLHKAGLQIYTMLVENRQGFPEAEEAAYKALDPDGDNEVWNAGLKLLVALVEKEVGIAKGLEEVKGRGLQVAQGICSYSGMLETVILLLGLCRALVKRGVGISEALTAAETADKNFGKECVEIVVANLYLFKAVVEKQPDRAAEALEAAKKATDFYYIPNVMKACIELFTTLFNHKIGFEEALKLAQACWNDGSYLRLDSLMLCCELVKKGHAVPEATEVAKQAIVYQGFNSDDVRTQGHALMNLLKEMGAEQNVEMGLKSLHIHESLLHTSGSI